MREIAKIALILGFILALLIPLRVHAQIEEAGLSSMMNLGKPTAFLKNINTPIAPKNIYEVDVDSPANKGGVGAVNTLTAWADIPTEMQQVGEEQNSIIAGCTIGLVQGIVSSLQRGAAGIYDVTTFSLPPYNDPMMEPEYKVQKPQDGFKVDLLKW